MDIVGEVRGRVAQMTAPVPQWRGQPELAGSPPAEIGRRFEALMANDTVVADEMVRSLIAAAQAGCTVAPLVLVAMLGPGILRISRCVPSPDPVGEVVGEFTEVLYQLPLERYRRSLAAALLLTTRRRLGRRRDRERRWDAWMAEQVHDRPSRWVGDELVELVMTVGLDRDDAALVVGTRVFDVPISELAARRGVTPAAVYKARSRIEQQLYAAA